MPNLIRQFMPNLHSQLVENFADTFTYQPAGGTAFTVELLLRTPDQQDATQAKFFTLRGRLSDFPAIPVRGDRCQFGTTVYRVIEVKVNQHGWLSMTCEATNDKSL